MSRLEELEAKFQDMSASESELEEFCDLMIGTKDMQAALKNLPEVVGPCLDVACSELGIDLSGIGDEVVW
jgi:hypothetical protein